MRNLTSSFLLLLLCCLLPTLSSAATTQTIHAEWNSYSPPSGMTVTGFRLYQDGTFACMTESPTATSMDCQVTLAGDSATFTLTATFSNGSESPHSAPVTYTVSTPAEPATGSTDPTTPTTPETTPTAPETSDTTTPPTSTTAPTQPTTGDTSSTTSPASTTSQSVHAEWNSYAPPSGLIVSGFKLYKDGTVACQVEGASATSLDCQVTLENSTANFTLTAFFTDGTESPHSAPVAFAAGGTTLPGRLLPAEPRPLRQQQSSLLRLPPERHRCRFPSTVPAQRLQMAPPLSTMPGVSETAPLPPVPRLHTASLLRALTPQL